MRARLVSALALLVLSAEAAADGSPGAGPGSSATLPLERLLELHDRARAEPPKPSPPPIAAAITEAAFTARLLDRAVDFTADFKVAVLGEEWVRVPLMQVDRSVHVRSLTSPEHGTVIVDEGVLTLVTRTPGEHAVRVSASKDARSNGRRRRIEIVPRQSTVAHMRVRFDAELFRLRAPGATPAGEEYALHPDGERFAIEWESRVEPGRLAGPATERVAIEPVITAARASVVCTLDGFQMTRIAYELRLQGAQPISFTLPRDGTLARVLLNGAPVPFAARDGTLELTVAPARSGDESARVELVLQGARRAFHLSGRLHFAFPAASWTTHLLDVSLHLPVVFDYAWAGGSLAPADPSDAGSGDGPPLPGKVLGFRQELISSSPDVAVSYTVDLDGQYFGG